MPVAGCGRGQTSPSLRSGPASLLSGELLAGWYDDWVVLERDRLRQLRMRTLEVVAVRLAAAGRHEEALQAAHAAVREEPLRESAHRVVIETHLAENNVGEALRQYQSCRRTLASGLGIAPSADLDTLLDTVVRGHRPGLAGGVVTAS